MMGPLPKPFIEIKNLTKVFHTGELEVEVLRGITLSIDEGEFVAIMGPSGSGKSTLMNLLGCLDRPTAGIYLLNGEDVSALDTDRLASLRRHTFGFIFQRYHLIPGLNAVENVEVPAIYGGMNRYERHRRAAELLTSLGLEDRLYYRPSQLSGGQQQRVSVARALMNGARVILADEPAGALDSRSGAETMNILRDLNEDGYTILLVTHDSNIARYAKRIVRIEDGQIVGEEVTRGMKETQVASSTKTMGYHNTSTSAFFTEVFKTAFRSLRIHRFRTFLTMLGIIIGVASVVTMLAIGTGAKQEVIERIQAMGTNLLLVRPGAPGVRGAGGTITTLIPEDARAIATLPGVKASVPEMIQPVTVRFGSVDFTTTATATTEEYPVVRNWSTSRGAFFQKEDMMRYSQVAVLGQTVTESLFKAENPMGKYVLIGNTPFKVTGVMEGKGADTGGNDMDNGIWIPLTTGSIRLFGQRFVKSISVQVDDEKAMDSVQSSIKGLLLKRHGKEDFQVRSMAALLETAQQTQNTLTYLLGAVAAISLMVGGIGVMNIMLVSVTERTKEIGIRMAVGARTGDVLLQFITEAVVVCLIGGLIGVGMGIASGVAISKAMGWRVLFSASPMLIAFTCAFVTGIIFGYLPAKKAARLDPVLALATE